MGTVYLSHTRGGQPVALKVIRREYAQDEEFRRRFQQEVQAARRVQGYHVVPVVDHDTTGDLPWLATDYVPGLPLDEALTRYGALPLAAVLQLTGCAAEALRAVHAAGVIHRDLKPSNVLLAANGPWVIDFGIARAADSTQLTRSGKLIGTPQFMSPEHANGQPLSPATDVFSLGLIAALSSTGRHPYGDAGAITLATKIANTAIQPPDLSRYPEALRPLLERCLSADPAARPSPAELAALCEQAAGRSLRDFTDWLPEPVATQIVRRQAAAQLPPGPELPAPPYPPGPTAYQAAAQSGYPSGAPSGYPSGLRTSYPPGPGTGVPAGSATGAPPAQGPLVPPQGPPSFPPTGTPSSGRARKLTAVGGGVVALVLAVTLTYVLTRPDHDAGVSTAGPTGAPVATTTDSPRPTTTAPDDEPATTPATDAPVTDTPPAGGEPQVLIRDRKFVIRSPAFNSGTHVELDRATVDPNGTIGDTKAFEIEYQDWVDDSMRFLTTFGKAEGTTYEACRTGVGADALPGEIFKKDLDDDKYFTKGTVLCTVTSDGNLAMLRITGETPSDDSGLTSPMPSYTTLLTVWRLPDSTSQSPGSG